MKKFKGPQGIVLTIDENDEDTPAYVEDKEKNSCTYDAAWSVWCEVPLTEQQLQWLKSKEDLVEEAFSKARSHWK